MAWHVLDWHETARFGPGTFWPGTARHGTFWPGTLCCHGTARCDLARFALAQQGALQIGMARDVLNLFLSIQIVIHSHPILCPSMGVIVGMALACAKSK